MNARRKRRWWRMLIPRTSTTVQRRSGGYIPAPGTFEEHRTHRDAPLSPRARAIFWLVSGLIVTVLLAITIYAAGR